MESRNLKKPQGRTGGATPTIFPAHHTRRADAEEGRKNGLAKIESFTQVRNLARIESCWSWNAYAAQGGLAGVLKSFCESTGGANQVSAIEWHVIKSRKDFGFGAQFFGARFARLG